jgi:hypothetical protein
MCADFVRPDFQYPDFLRSAALGQQMGQQQAMAPLQIQGAQQGLAQGEQGLQTGQLNLDMLRQMMGMRSQAMQGYQQTMAGINGAQPTQTGGQPGGPTGGAQNGPQGAVSQPQSNDPLAPFLDPRRIAANAAMGQFGAMMNGKDPNEPVAKGLELEAAARKDQQERAKIQAQPGLNMLDSVFNSDSPAKTVMSNPGMIAHWPKVAAMLGLDPVKDFNDTNVRKGLAIEANTLRAQSGQPAKDYPVALQTTQRGLGESVQTDPVTGKISGGAPALPTEKYIDNGQVVERTKAQGVGQGLTPYDPSLYAATKITPDALEQAYQTTKATGTPPAQAGRDVVALAAENSYIAKRAKEDGLTGVGMAAQQQLYKAQQGVLDDFTNPNGKAGGKLGAINTTTEHIAALVPLIDAMKNGNQEKITAARQQFETTWKGQPAPTNYQTLANIAVGELSNAVTANGGDASERERITAPFKGSLGPDVLKGAANTAITAMAGKTDSLKTAWNAAKMNEDHGSFEQFLGDATKRALKSGNVHPAAVQSLLDKYHP